MKQYAYSTTFEQFYLWTLWPWYFGHTQLSKFSNRALSTDHLFTQFVNRITPFVTYNAFWISCIEYCKTWLPWLFTFSLQNGTWKQTANYNADTRRTARRQFDLSVCRCSLLLGNLSRQSTLLAFLIRLTPRFHSERKLHVTCRRRAISTCHSAVFAQFKWLYVDEDIKGVIITIYRTL